MMEGVGYAVLHNFELMQGSGVKMRFPIVLCEGGARSPLWRQIIADILNVECAFAPSSPGAPAGDALLAGVGVGILKDYDLFRGRAAWGEKSIPNPANHARYMKLYAVFRSLYPALKNQYVDLAEAISTDVPL
jgi:xylulokinase